MHTFILASVLLHLAHLEGNITHTHISLLVIRFVITKQHFRCSNNLVNKENTAQYLDMVYQLSVWKPVASPSHKRGSVGSARPEPMTEYITYVLKFWMLAERPYTFVDRCRQHIAFRMDCQFSSLVVVIAFLRSFILSGNSPLHLIQSCIAASTALPIGMICPPRSSALIAQNVEYGKTSVYV